MNKKKIALMVVDVQNDFCPGGALAIQEGDRVVSVINQIQPIFDTIIATQDWHPFDHVSFATTHSGKKVHDVIDIHGISQILWPPHCVSGTMGAAFHPGLETERFRLILHKGMNPILDAVAFGFDTSVVLDACCGVDVPKGNIEKAIRRMKKSGIKIISSSELLS